MGAVICYWDDYLDVVGPTMDTIRYPSINKIILYSKIQLVVYYQCCVLIGSATTRLYVIAL